LTRLTAKKDRLQKFWTYILNALVSLLIERGIKPLMDYINEKSKQRQKKKETIKALEKVKNAQTKDEFNSSVDDL